MLSCYPVNYDINAAYKLFMEFHKCLTFSMAHNKNVDFYGKLYILLFTKISEVSLFAFIYSLTENVS